MRAIVHNIHSQVPNTLRKLNVRPGAIVSLDSHLDLSLGGDDRVYPRELRVIARRTGAHTAMRNLLGDSSRSTLMVAIPERMMARHASDIESNLPRRLRENDQGESVASVVRFLRDERGVEILQSPPSSLLGLVPRTKKRGRWVLDIDVDYMQEMQSECYTRIVNREPGVLQSMANVVGFISGSKPELITISEAKVSAIRDAKSNFSVFMTRLKELGYKAEESGVTMEDEQVVRGISVCTEFYRRVSKKLVARHADRMMKGDYRGFLAEEERAAKVFFESKGYG
ncbi:MAG: hypothetical protein JRN09_04520 [Nitrososphaerota archaeon]|nr:hypothetical protein [Nitrososphaerota archaeon]